MQRGKNKLPTSESSQEYKDFHLAMNFSLIQGVEKEATKDNLR
jgi:hypothetical protein